MRGLIRGVLLLVLPLTLILIGSGGGLVDLRALPAIVAGALTFLAVFAGISFLEGWGRRREARGVTLPLLSILFLGTAAPLAILVEVAYADQLGSGGAQAALASVSRLLRQVLRDPMVALLSLGI